MDHVFEMKGVFNSSDIVEILSMILKSDKQECKLELTINDHSKKILIKNNKISFIYSNDLKENFYEYLKNNTGLEESDLDKAKASVFGNGSRLGKELVESDLITYEELWSYVENHQKLLLKNISESVSGEYNLDWGSVDISENIELNIPIESFLLEKIRNNEFADFIQVKFEIVNELFIINKNPELPADILPFEQHVLSLCLKLRDIDLILRASELKEADTLKYIYYFYLIDVLSTEKKPVPEIDLKEDYLSMNISFSSYEEALKHYNIKFEMIYKIVSKEIGPVALSILSNSIDDIRDNLPVFLKGAEIDKNGRLIEKKILKKVWYHDFENHSSEFVRGLEELLYAQIFAVKKNLGIDYENQILRWLKGTGN